MSEHIRIVPGDALGVARCGGNDDDVVGLGLLDQIFEDQGVPLAIFSPSDRRQEDLQQG